MQGKSILAAQDIHMSMSENAAIPLLIHYLDAVVTLTRQHDTQGLTVSLIDFLRQHLQAEHFQLLAISNLNKDAEFNEDNVQGAVVHDCLGPSSAPAPIQEDNDLLACVRDQRRVSRSRPDAGGHRLILPILGARYVTALLVIEGWQEGRGEVEVLTRLLQIYGNQAFLLSRNELDGLTSLYNRQSFDERIKRLVLNAGRQERRAPPSGAPPQNCLVLFDLDHFKQVNDQYGHLYGDEVLVQFARLMSHSFRQEDLLFRYGGEEFAAVLVGVAPGTAVGVLESFRQKVEAYPFPQIGHKTVSVGVTGILPGESVDTIINRADKALYHAKQHGRNQVCCYETLVTEGRLAPVTVATGDIELF